jgi:hypothetical protein
MAVTWSVIVPFASHRPEAAEALIDFWIPVARSGLAEVIITENCDSFISADIAHRAASCVALIHVRNPRVQDGINQKIFNVMNALGQCRGEHVLLVDDDMRPTPACLATLSAALREADAARFRVRLDPIDLFNLIDQAGNAIVDLFAAEGQIWGGIAFRRDAARIYLSMANDVLFDDYNFIKALRTAGQRVVVACGLTMPSNTKRTAAKFLEQRVRYARENAVYPKRQLLFSTMGAALITLALLKPMAAASLLLTVCASAIVFAFLGLKGLELGARRRYLTAPFAAPWLIIQMAFHLLDTVKVRLTRELFFGGRILTRVSE